MEADPNAYALITVKFYNIRQTNTFVVGEKAAAPAADGARAAARGVASSSLRRDVRTPAGSANAGDRFLVPGARQTTLRDVIHVLLPRPFPAQLIDSLSFPPATSSLL